MIPKQRDQVVQFLHQLRSHRRIAAAFGGAMVVFGGGLLLAYNAQQAPSAPRAAHSVHAPGKVSGPTIEDPRATPQPSVAITPSTTVIRYGRTDTSVDADISVAAPTVAIPSEGAPGVVAVTTPLPPSIALPPGSEPTVPTVRYPNGVTEWVYGNSSIAHADAIVSLRSAFSKNGWTVTSEATDAPITTPQGVSMIVHHLYVASAQYRGLVNVNGGPAIPNVSIQIDLSAK